MGSPERVYFQSSSSELCQISSLAETFHPACSSGWEQEGEIPLNEFEPLEETVETITWRSMRVTLLAEAVKNQVDDKVVGLQANWKDPKQLVLKYARQRKEISVAMVKDMTDKIKKDWRPDREAYVVDEDDEDDVPEPFMPIEYLVKSKVPERALVAGDVKCHILDPSVNSEVSLCGRLALKDADSVGRRPPCMVCKICQQKADPAQD